MPQLLPTPDDWALKQSLVQFLGDHRSVRAAEAEISQLRSANPARKELDGWLADLYITHQATDQAITLLQQMIVHDQGQPEALNAETALARIDFVRGDKPLAERLVAGVLATDPENRQALLIGANLAYDQGAYEKVVSDLRTVLRDKPQDSEALQLLAEALLKQGRLDLATDTLGDLVESSPGNLAAKVRLAQLRATAGDQQAALDLLGAVTKADPAYAIGWESLARVAIVINNIPLAEQAIQKLHGLAGQELTARFLAGQLAAKQGHVQAAQTAYNQVIDADPASPLAEHSLTALIEQKTAKGESGTVTPYLESLHGKVPLAETLLAESYLQAGQTEPATAALDAAIAQHPRDQRPYLDRSRLYLAAHQPEQALSLVKEAAAAVPADPRALLMQADILGQLGRFPEAIALYDTILHHNPGLDVAANNEAALIADHAYEEPAQLAKAAELVQRFTNSTNPALLDTLGWVAFRRGNITAAVAVFSQMTTNNAVMTPEMHYHYGTALAQQGQKDAARAELQQATAADVTYPAKPEAERLLQGL